VKFKANRTKCGANGSEKKIKCIQKREQKTEGENTDLKNA
jgi:hypothetical protein